MTDRRPTARAAVVRAGHGNGRLSVGAALAAGALVFALSTWVTISTVSYFGNRQLLSESFQQIANLEQAYGDLLSASQLSTASFVEQIGELEARSARQREAIGELTAIQASLGRQLASRDRQLAGIAEQRNRAHALIGELEHAMTEVEQLMGDVLAEKSVLKAEKSVLKAEKSVLKAEKSALKAEKSALNERLEAAHDRLAEVSQQRDAERQVEVGLRWQLARLEDEVQQLRSRRESAQTWLKDWVLGSTEALEQLFVETGVDVEGLIERAATPEHGQGGPLQVANVDLVGGRLTLGTPPSDPMGNNIQRLSALQRLARTLPLASPLDHFYLTSAFGKRRDPFTRDWAYHAGLDFSAATDSKVLATAPGRVVHAGPAGPYGNMVEIDHGMGVVTRYGHMKRVEAAVGDEVQFRQELGVIGNTGRSTAVHLHYEIRIDDIAYDPARFLDAGRSLVGIFANGGYELAGEG